MGQEPPIQPPVQPPPPPEPYQSGGTGGLFGASGSQDKPLAEWWKRVVAALIDGAIVGIPSYIIMTVFSFGVARRTQLTIDPQTGRLIGGGGTGMFAGFFASFFVIFLLGIAYYVYFHGTTGQTIGKKVMSIMVVGEETGLPIGYGPAFVRWLIAGLLGFVPCVGFLLDDLWPLWDPKRQALHDKVVKSLVVDVS